MEVKRWLVEHGRAEHKFSAQFLIMFSIRTYSSKQHTQLPNDHDILLYRARIVLQMKIMILSVAIVDAHIKVWPMYTQYGAGSNRR